MSRNQSSIRLPKSLLEELENSSGNQRNRPKHHAPRKEARKQYRLESKKRRAEHFASTRQPQQKKRAPEEHTDAPEPKRFKQEQPAPKPKLKAKQTPLQKLVESSQKPSLSHRDQQEDDYISYLESKLGWKKNGSKTGAYGSGLGEDGLDDLLKDLDAFGPSKANALGFDDEDQSDEENDEGYSEDDSSFMAEDEDAYEEWGGFGHLSEASHTSLEEAETSEAEPEETLQKSEHGSRYLPPHRRKVVDDKNTNDSEAIIKLNKQLKGLLNRLSEQNISSILDNVEETYRNNRRNDVTSALTTLIIDGISSHSVHLDSYVVLYAAFIASLHRLVGVEFAAFFVQNVVSSYETHLNAVLPSAPADTEVHGKEASNLIVLLSELYNFQVISCVLVYDIIRGLLSRPHLTEYNVELLLKITRSSGLQLRQDDPSALKDIIQMVHAKIPDQKSSLSSRTNFMIETLTNLKNNKLKKAVAGGAGGTGGPEAVERLKKFLSGMSKKRHVMSHEPLRITLEDLHSAESKGKWWLVGAAWNGDPLVDRKTLDQTKGNKPLNNEDKLIKLAKKQGMNTEIRRSIFVIIMSSEDYVDACERLGQLRLIEVQQREIVRVLLHCCGNERSYNPYYTLICQHLCRTSHSYKVTLQFCMWDFLRELGESNVGGMELLKRQQDEGFAADGKTVGKTKLQNIAKAYAWWIAKDSCSLAILKPVDFTILKAQTRLFLKELLLHTFISSQISTPAIAESTKLLLEKSSRNRAALEEIFIKATRIETLAMGLMYFVSEAFKELTTDDFMSWAVQVVKDGLRSGVDIGSDL